MAEMIVIMQNLAQASDVPVQFSAPPPPAPTVSQTMVAQPDALKGILKALVSQQAAQAEA